MRKLLLIGLLIGLVLSLLQATVVYTVTKNAGCDMVDGYQNCLDIKIYGPKFYRGWPLANASAVGAKDEFGEVHSYYNPLASYRTFINVPIIIALSMLITVLVGTLLKSLHLGKSSGLILGVALLVGLGLATAQIFYTRQQLRLAKPFDLSAVTPCEEKVPGCGYCPPEQKNGNYCNLPPAEHVVRGWPFTHDTYGQLSIYDKSPTLLLNGMIIVASVIGLTAVGLTFKKHI